MQKRNRSLSSISVIINTIYCHNEKLSYLYLWAGYKLWCLSFYLNSLNMFCMFILCNA